MIPTQHPILDREFIDMRGVIVTEVHSMPAVENSFQSEALVIGLCLSGTATFEYNMQPTRFVPQEIGVTLPNSLLTYSNTSPDYRSVLVIISKRFFNNLILRSSFIDYKKYYYHPGCHLNDERFEKVKAILRVLQIISDSEHPKRTETLENLLDLLFYSLTRYRNEEQSKSSSELRKEQLFSLFYDLLSAHFAGHHNIGWYAGELSISPKYLSSVIRDTTGKTAAEWIDIVLLNQAKKLLHSQRTLTVQQVAFELGYNESSTFCRFFKDHTSLTPSAYRLS